MVLLLLAILHSRMVTSSAIDLLAQIAGIELLYVMRYSVCMGLQVTIL